MDTVSTSSANVKQHPMSLVHFCSSILSILCWIKDEVFNQPQQIWIYEIILTYISVLKQGGIESMKIVFTFQIGILALYCHNLNLLLQVLNRTVAVSSEEFCLNKVTLQLTWYCQVGGGGCRD